MGHKSHKLNNLTDLKGLVEIISQGGVHSVDDLSDEMNRTKEYVRRLVAKHRKKFNNGDEDFDSWIFTTKGGYTMDEKAEHAAYETRMRLALGIGTIVNGHHPISTTKRLIPKQFNAMMIEYRPKMITFEKVTK